MEIHEIEAHIEIATERLQQLAEQLSMLELNGYCAYDADWIDIVIEARELMGYKSELCLILEERLANQNKPFDSNATDDENDVCNLTSCSNEANDTNQPFIKN